jgi:hypothetical protein
MSSNSDKPDVLLNNPDKIGSFSLGIFITCIAFTLPLGLMYSMVFYKKKAWYRVIFLYGAVLGLGYITCLLFYRMALKEDKEAQINKMNGQDALFVLYNTLAGFVVVLITIFALSTNPSLVTIFENTLGYLFIHAWGVTELCNGIFVSDKFSEYSNINPREFNYNFLITRINTQNVEEFINSEKMNEDTNLPLDFKMHFQTTDQVEKLRNLVHLKYSFGHFVWIYLASIVSLIIAMMGCIMYS